MTVQVRRRSRTRNAKNVNPQNFSGVETAGPTSGAPDVVIWLLERRQKPSSSAVRPS